MEAVATARSPSRVHVCGRRVKLGWAVFALTCTVLVVALALDVATGTYKTVPYSGVNVVLALIGVLLTTRRPEHRISWVLAIMALWGTVGGLCYAYAVEALVADPGSLPGGLVAAWFDNWWWLPGLALPLGVLLVLMPDGHLASRRWWPIPAAVAVGTVLGSVAVSASPTFDLGTATPIENPLARAGGSTIVIVGIVGVILVIAGLVASLGAFIVRYRRSEGDERQQLRWVGVSLGLAVPLFVVGALLWGVVPGAALLTGLAFLLLPAGIAVAVLKYRLYEIDLVINRALVYGVMTMVVVASYVAVVGLVGATLSSRGDLFLSLVVTGVVAVCFQPVRERVQRFVNRLMYGERDDPYTAIATARSNARGSLRLDTVLPTIVETIGQTLALQYVGSRSPRAPTGSRDRRRIRQLQRRLPHVPARSPGNRARRAPPRSARRRAAAGARPPPDRRPRTPGRRRRPRSRSLPRTAGWRDGASSSFAKRSDGASVVTSTTASGLRWPGSRSHSRPSVTSPARIFSVPTNCSSRRPSRYRR